MYLRKLYRLYILIILFCFSFQPLLSQTKILTGTVTDSHSDEAIPFASISFRGTTVGKLSDSSGFFIFVLSKWPADTLEVSCVGYQPLFILMNHQPDSLNLVLKMERGTFNEGVKVRAKVNRGLLVWRKIV